jgi:hypothetical protein
VLHALFLSFFPLLPDMDKKLELASAPALAGVEKIRLKPPERWGVVELPEVKNDADEAAPLL